EDGVAEQGDVSEGGASGAGREGGTPGADGAGDQLGGGQRLDDRRRGGPARGVDRVRVGGGGCGVHPRTLTGTFRRCPRGAPKARSSAAHAALMEARWGRARGVTTRGLDGLRSSWRAAPDAENEGRRAPRRGQAVRAVGD